QVNDVASQHIQVECRRSGIDVPTVLPDRRQDLLSDLGLELPRLSPVAAEDQAVQARLRNEPFDRIAPSLNTTNQIGGIHFELVPLRNAAKVELDPVVQPQHLADVSNQEPRLAIDRKSTRLNSSHVKISYAVFCLKKKR